MDFLFSIWTMYNYDETLFDNMQVPTGVDLELLTDNLIVELAEFELLYDNPEMMKFMIEKWSKKEVPQWQKLYDTTTLDYNPIENYNRTEVFSETETRDLEQTDNETRNLANTDNETRDLAGTDNETRDLAGTSVLDSDATGSTTNTGTDQVNTYNYGFNSDTAVLNEKTDNILGSGNNTTGTIDSTENITDTGTVNKSVTDTGTVNRNGSDTGTVDKTATDIGTVKHDRNGNTYGNIGVTTTQQMIEQERNTVKFNIYDYIITEFKKRFCIMIY